MKKIILMLLFGSCIGYLSCKNELSADRIFPIEQVNTELVKSDNMKIVVVMPSISDSTEYASMIVQAFKNYFVDKFSFPYDKRDSINIDIVLLEKESKNKTDTVSENNISKSIFPLFGHKIDLFETNGMYVEHISDSLMSQLNIPAFSDYNASSTLFLLDKNNKIILRDDDYRGQGEHLKPLEHKIKKLLGFEIIDIQANRPNLEVGDKAPSVPFTDYKGKISVLTFYPAAFSGVFDTNNMARIQSMRMTAMMSCAIQVTSLDRVKIPNQSIRYYAISESTQEILNNWQNILATHHIHYMNDANYSITQAFGAYNEQGYANRMTVIVDKKGKIAYINDSYTLDQEDEIRKVVNSLSK